jgi:hypothetical protein
MTTDTTPPADPQAPQRTDLAGLREALFATLRDVRTGAIDLDRARTVNAIAGTLIDSARGEVEYRRVVDQAGASTFIEGGGALPGNGIGRMVHRLKG